MKMNNFMFVLLHPSFWMSPGGNPQVDDLINHLIDAEKPVELSNHTAYIGGVKIWVSNYPYAYGSVESCGDGIPYPITRVRLRNYICKKTIESLEISIALKGGKP